MIKEIALAMSKGLVTPAILAANLGISQEKLGEYLFRMENMGYVKFDDAAECTDPEESCCHACGCSHLCSDTRTDVRSCTLTEKGRKLAGAE